MFNVGDSVSNNICKTMSGTLIKIYNNVAGTGVVKLKNGEEIAINLNYWHKTKRRNATFIEITEE